MNQTIKDENGNLLNGVYHGISKDRSFNYIINFSDGKSQQYICLGKATTYGITSAFYQEWGSYTPATEEEIQWLDDCTLAGTVTERKKKIKSPFLLF